MSSDATLNGAPVVTVSQFRATDFITTKSDRCFRRHDSPDAVALATRHGSLANPTNHALGGVRDWYIDSRSAPIPDPVPEAYNGRIRD